MKKVFFFAAAVLVMASCNSTETLNVSTPQQIGFYTMAQNATKGYVTGTAFEELTNPNNEGFNNSDEEITPESREMKVSAFNKTDSQDYFISKTFKQQSTTDNLWKNYEGGVFKPIYWPIGKDLQFLAYSSQQSIEDRPEPVANWESAKKVSFDITAEQCYQNDILYAQAKGSNRGTAGTETSSSTTGLPIKFYHSQAWITFNVTAIGDQAEEKEAIDLKQIVLKDVYNSGTLTFEYAEGAEQPTAKWNFFTQEPTDVIVDDAWDNAYEMNAIYKTDDDTNGVQLNMLMPAQKHNEFVLYYIANETEGSVVLPFNKESPEYGEWKMGNHYTYNVTISINEITFDPTVNVWETVTPFETEI